MKSIKSFLLVLVLSLAVLAGCNVTVNEAPEADTAEETSSVDTEVDVVDDETDTDDEDADMEDEEGIDDEEDTDTEDTDDSDTDEEDEDTDSGITLEISDDMKMIEVEKVDLPDINPDSMEMKINPDEVMIKVEQ